MGQLVRFGVSMDAELLAAFDALIRGKGYANRSEAIRDLVRDALVQTQWDTNSGRAVAALCLVYDHHVRELSNRLIQIQHDLADQVVSTLHVHVSHRNCLEVLILKGQPRHLKEMADRLISTRGVMHGRLIMTTTGENIA